MAGRGGGSANGVSGGEGEAGAAGVQAGTGGGAGASGGTGGSAGAPGTAAAGGAVGGGGTAGPGGTAGGGGVAGAAGAGPGTAGAGGTPDPLANAPTLMPLGDSITEGGPSAGYRSDLFATGKYRPVGSLTTDPPTLLADPSPYIHHEGHMGQTSQYIRDNIAALWAENPADIVLYMLGMNDAIAGTDPAVTAANVVATIDHIHAQSPTTHVYVMGPTNATTAHPGWNALLDAQRPNNQAIVAMRSGWCGYIAMPHLDDDQMDGGPHPRDHAAYSLLSAAITAVLP